MEPTSTKPAIIVVASLAIKMTKPLITVLLPTRKRTAMVKKSITTVLELATDPTRLRIAIAYDSDDAESETYFGSNEWKLLVENTGATQVVYKIERQGWMELHEYYNHLAQNSNSDWYLIWNDDAFMQTQGWDQEIHDNKDYQGLISMECNGKRPDSTLFPCVPKQWIDTFDMIGMNPVDQWIQDITYELGCYKRINAKIFHDHFQFTGNNNDEVYQETSKNKKFTKRAYKTNEMSELKQSWIAQWRSAINEN
jgi:hypothetical protein